MRNRRLAFVSFSLLFACAREVDVSEDEAAIGDPCGAASDCVAGATCEPVQDSEDSVCAEAVELRGTVANALDGTPIEGAHIVALDSGGAPSSDVAITDAEGLYVLEVIAPRDENGDPVSGSSATLVAFAADFAPVPSGIRPALPIDLDSGAYEEGEPGEDGGDPGPGRYVIENASTDVGMVLLPDDQQGGGQISGVIEGDLAGGTLVVADGNPSRWTIADRSGAYTIFNLGDGSYTVDGYRGGQQLETQEADVTPGESTALDFAEGPEAAAAVSGSINIVNAPGGAESSVVLVPAAVYDDFLERGPVPLGLRAPQPGLSPNVTSGFEIPGVPEGTYKVLAAFENDDLVRDPDESIAGTDILEVTVTGSDTALDASFKITEALDIVSPGNEDPEVVGASPTFVFADDSSEDRYEVVVIDALGEQVWEDLAVPGVSGDETVEVSYGGPALTSGMYYQFRVTSFKDTPNGSTALSRTEDLRGVFVVE